ncbi:hypothetical protein [Erythrobacter sp. HKB08]|uniref:hypothetical protein n=1 Tax=Erythrobacter sp. HKB08 TaxID=2502843 RepID=UPI0010092BC0|nr:hypothetical protein [Erythrobacter sp. HKB08]
MKAALAVVGAGLLWACAATPAVDTAVASEEAAPGHEWSPVHPNIGLIRDYDGLKELARDFPDSSSVRRRLLAAEIEEDRVEDAMASLEWLYDRGYIFSDRGKAAISQMLAGVDPGRIAERLRADSEVIATSEVVATIPAEAGLVESVLLDLDTGRMAATSVSGGSVWAGSASGPWQEIRPESVANLSGIVFEPSSGRIWVAAGAIDGAKDPEPRFTGLIGLDAAGGAEIRIAAPEGANLSDLHRRDGVLYASDPIGGGVYSYRIGADAMRTLVPPKILRSPQGLVTSEDGRTLYVSDYSYGLAAIDIESGRVSRVSTELPILLDGIDGLWRQGNELIAVQNGINPMRIVGLTLGSDGRSIVGHRVLEQANPEWIEPLSGYLGRGALYYVGNGQWGSFVEGELADGKTLAPTQIRKLATD